jgi:stalled ribosome rescue protein Dom34
MSVKAGVWIDHRQAILVVLTDKGQEIRKIASDIADTGRPSSGNAHSSHDYVSEDSQERKFESELKAFYDQVIDGLQGAQTLLILGPGEAKVEFHKRLESKKQNGTQAEVVTADKMTEGQLVAKVVQHFASTRAQTAK